MLDATSSEIAAIDTVHGVSKEEYRRMKDWLDRKIEAGKKKPFSELVALIVDTRHG